MRRANYEAGVEEEAGEEMMMPCNYCVEWGPGILRPWVKQMLTGFRYTEEQLGGVTERVFFRLVRGRGVVEVDSVPGLKVLLDGTGRDTRIVLVDLGRIFEDFAGSRNGVDPIGLLQDREVGVLAVGNLI